MKKILDISDDTITAITIEGAKMKPKMVFKLLAQKILEDYAKPFMAFKKPKSVRKSFKNK